MWLVYAAINALGSSLNNLFIKMATGKISSVLGALFVYLGGLFTVLVLFPFLGEKVSIGKQGVLLALAAGAVSILASIAWFRMYKLGAPISTATVITLLSIMVLSTIFGVIFFQEKITIRFILGIFFAIIALYFLITASR